MTLASRRELVLTGSTCTRVLVRLGGQDSCVRQVSDCFVQKRSVVMQQCNSSEHHTMPLLGIIIIIIIIIIMNFYSPVSNTRCHSIGHKMRIARIKIRVDSQGRWERA